jgi:hypothetical protein
MEPDPFHLQEGQLALLVPDVVRHTEASDVVQEPGPTNGGRFLPADTQTTSRLAGEVGHGARVTEGVGGLDVGEVGDGLEGGVDVRTRHGDVQDRLGRDHGIPGRHPIEVGEDLGTASQNTSTRSGSNRVPLRDRATATAASTPPAR